MNTKDAMEDRLWEFIDGRSNAAERSDIEKLIDANNEWRHKYNELLEIHKLLQASELESPSLRFSKNVMEEIGRLQISPATRSYINNRLIWGLGLFFITMVVGFIVYGFGQADWTTKGDSIIPENISKININNFFSNTWMNVLMMINVVLGLFLLDNYLSQKKKKFQRGREL